VKKKDTRPRPESFLDLIRQEGRGNLKIFLGFAPGVGKTYRMLQEAHQLRQKGVDVVVGIVDTHGREDTEKLLDGLEQIPPRK
jgi:two-component system sensor histidine kinase KdpD